MGLGNVGSFIAHALRGLTNPPPVTLIFSRRDRLNEWIESPKRLTLITEGDAESLEGFDAEIAIPRQRYHGKEVGTDAIGDLHMSDRAGARKPQTSQADFIESSEPISSLIMCSKASYVLQTLSAVKHRLSKDSTILFLQNGMGTIDEVNREIFPDPAVRPHYMLGINSHGVHSSPDGLFATVHAGFGTIALGILPHERDRNPASPHLSDARSDAISQLPSHRSRSEDMNAESPPSLTSKFPWTTTQRYLLRTLLRAPVLGAAAYSPPNLLQLQLDKLAVNCIVNPLTVVLDARNGAILNNYALTRTMRLLLAEISLVIRSLPELQYIPNVQQRFDPGRLETIVVSVAHKTANNISSMLADTRSGQQTEIDYINGWIVKRGEELGVRCLMNYMLVQMVKGKTQVVQRELSEGVAFVEDKQPRRDDDVIIKTGQAEKDPKL
ncbi:2-dehydropantoate 2-reductase (Ketopantoate reductase) (KPA reductase) (KPR) [Coniothyrium glycines]